MIHVYAGDGKGKTSAALGLAFRAAGWGYATYMAQFMKGRPTGELNVNHPLIRIEQFGTESFDDPGDIDGGIEAVVKAFHTHEIVVADELLTVWSCGLKSLKNIDAIIEYCPRSVEFVLTGSDVPLWWARKAADVVTIFHKDKHPYDFGVKARKGIEF